MLHESRQPDANGLQMEGTQGVTEVQKEGHWLSALLFSSSRSSPARLLTSRARLLP